MEIPFNLPAFPVDVFPADIRHFIVEAARALNCPIDLVGVPVLTVMSSAIGSSRAIKLKEEWVEPPVLFSGVIAPPSSKKSPAFSLVMRPVYKVQQELKQLYDEKKEIYQSDLEKWERNKKSNSKPIKPVFKRNFINDFTFEALVKILNYNPKGVLLGLDELTGWVSSMDQYRNGKGSDKDKWLSIWSCGLLTVDRASWEEALMIPYPFVSVTGGIQPDRIKHLQSKDHDGFMGRILFSFPEPMRDIWVEEGVSKEIMSDYINRYRLLYQLEPELVEANYITPKKLEFTPMAKDSFKCFFYANVDDIEHEVDPYLKAAFKKLEAYTARFALIIQLCYDHKSEVVEKEAVEAAVVLTEYFKAHARKVYAFLGDTKVNAKILHAVERLRANNGTLSLRECYTGKVSGCKTSKQALKLFEELQKKGYGKIEHRQASTGGRATITFQMHNY